MEFHDQQRLRVRKLLAQRLLLEHLSQRDGPLRVIGRRQLAEPSSRAAPPCSRALSRLFCAGPRSSPALSSRSGSVSLPAASISSVARLSCDFAEARPRVFSSDRVVSVSINFELETANTAAGL